MSITEKTMYNIFDGQVKKIDKLQADLGYPDDVTYQINESYDLIKPKGNNISLPLIINIHGGAFSSGDKKINRFYASYLAQKGYEVATLNYAYLPESDFLGQLNEVSNKIKELSSNIEHNGLYLTADSSGAYLTSIITFLWNNKELQKKFGIDLPNVKLNAVGLTGNPTTYKIFPKFMINYYNKIKELLLSGNTEIEDLLDYNKLLSSNICPIFLMSCKGDMYLKQNIEFDKWLTKNNIEHDRHFSMDEKLYHCANVVNPTLESSKETNNEMIKFFNKTR